MLRSLPGSALQDRKVLHVGNAVLRKKAKMVAPDRVTAETSRNAVGELIRVMRGPRLLGREKGGALALPQLGTPSRLVAIEDPAGYVAKLSEEQRKQEGRLAPFGPKVVFNPRVRPLAQNRTVVLWEGSASVPAYRALVERPVSVQVLGTDPEGRPVDYVASGWEARLMQQAVDVLDGVLFIDRCIMRSLRHLDAKDDPLPPDVPPMGLHAEEAQGARLSEEELAAAAERGSSQGFLGLPGFGRSSMLLVGSLLLRLRAKEVPLDDITSGRVDSVARELREALASGKHELGVAAPQFGHRLRVIAVGESEEQFEKLSARSRVQEEHAVFGPLLLFNPVLRRREKSSDAYFFERSASVPGYEAVVGRALEVDVEALNDKGEPARITARGWQARIFQHAVDVLDGTLYVDRMERRSFRRDTIEEALPEDVPFGVRGVSAVQAAKRARAVPTKAAAATRPPSGREARARR